MDTVKSLVTIFLLLILSKSVGHPAAWVVGPKGNSWDNKVSYANTVKVQSTGRVELSQLVDDYVSYWRFDENSGGTVHDENTVNHNDGILTNMIVNSWAAGYHDYALEFDGDNDYVDCGNDLSLDSSAYTVSFWLKVHNLTTHQELVRKYHFDGTDAYGFIIDVDINGSMRFFNYKGSVWSAVWTIGQNGEITIDTWYYLTCTYDGSTAKYYLNKILTKTAVGTGFKTSSNDFLISAAYYTVNGIIDEVKYYNRVLSETEIGQVMGNEHYPAGQLTSISNDAQFVGTVHDVWNQIGFNAVIPSGTSVDLFLRTSFDNGFNDPWTDWTLVQANAVSGAIYDLPIKNRERYGQWKLDLKTNDSSLTPQIESVTLISGTMSIEPEGGKISVGPNPFTPARPPYNKVYFDLDNFSVNSIKLEIYSSKGRLVFEKAFNSGENVFWDGRNNQSEIAEDGAYIYQVKTEDKTYNGTLILAR
ncbi:MAG: LamG-like jellyroll fold domain-containing protein [Elusimicrobiota bacterium]